MTLADVAYNIAIFAVSAVFMMGVLHLWIGKK